MCKKLPGRQEGECKIIPPLPQMREFFPSRGDRPPPKEVFPPTDPEVIPDPEPVALPCIRPWPMDKRLSMQERWESLTFPRMNGWGGTDYSPDRVAVDIAINGLKLKMLSSPPMSSRDNPRFLLSPVCRRAQSFYPMW